MLTQSGGSSDQRQPLNLGGWRVDALRGVLEHGERSVRLEPKVMQTLLALIAHRGEPATREVLVQRVWGHEHVTDDALNRCIARLRKVFAEVPGGPSIETLPKVGYVLHVPDGSASGRSAGFRMGTLLGLALVAALVVLWSWRSPAPDTSSVSAAGNAYRVSPLTHEPGLEVGASFSPDGAQVAYAHRAPPASSPWRIHVRTVGAGGARLFSQGEGNHVAPAWSPDGRTIAYLAFSPGQCDVMLADVGDGAARRLTACHADSDHGLAWMHDGGALMYTPPSHGPRTLARLNLDTLTSEPMTEPAANDLGDSVPRASPNGEWMAFTRWHDYGVGDVFALSLADGSLKPVTRDYVKVHGFDWLNDEHLVIGSNRGGPFALWQVSLEGGPPQPLSITGVELDSPVRRPGSAALAYESWRSQTDVVRIGLSDGSRQPVSSSTRWEWSGVASPGDGRIAFVSDRSGAPEIWVQGQEGQATVMLTQLKGPYINDLNWSADGEWIYFSAPVEHQFEIHRVPARGGTVQQLTTGPGSKRYPQPDKAGNGFYFGLREHGEWRVARSVVSEPDAAATGERDVIVAGSVPRLAPDEESLYVADCINGGLVRFNLRRETQVMVMPSLLPVDCQSWAVLPDGLVAVLRGADYQPGLVRIGPNGNALTELLLLPDLRFGNQVSMSGDAVVVTEVVEREVDLMLADPR